MDKIVKLCSRRSMAPNHTLGCFTHYKGNLISNATET